MEGYVYVNPYSRYRDLIPVNTQRFCLDKGTFQFYLENGIYKLRNFGINACMDRKMKKAYILYNGKHYCIGRISEVSKKAISNEKTKYQKIKELKQETNNLRQKIDKIKSEIKS